MDLDHRSIVASDRAVRDDVTAEVGRSDRMADLTLDVVEVRLVHGAVGLSSAMRKPNTTSDVPPPPFTPARWMVTFCAFATPVSATLISLALKGPRH